MGKIGFYILVELAIAAGLFLILPRRLCIVLGGIGMLFGIATPIAIWSYEGLFATGDTSAYGMTGTLLAILFGPGGITLTILGFIKST